jgi:hypothetical protein
VSGIFTHRFNRRPAARDEREDKAIPQFGTKQLDIREQNVAVERVLAVT